ncbi:MAG: C40 family peptidase [Oculatellaceae cyanobacterium Prado106]|nr:C40 family peptidase [Oculatellaceae cyanobacterium Prado106]
MLTLPQLQSTFDAGHFPEYQCLGNLNLYDSPEIKDLATQAVAGRQLKFLPLPTEQNGRITGQAIQVRLCEDDYPGWLPLEDLDLLAEAEAPYEAIALSPQEIGDRIPQVIRFAQAAMTQPNYYLWGGTVGPNYDCSGLVQTAFTVAGASGCLSARSFCGGDRTGRVGDR